jgi:hypothetical protein
VIGSTPAIDASSAIRSPLDQHSWWTTEERKEAGIQHYLEGATNAAEEDEYRHEHARRADAIRWDSGAALEE